MSLRYAGKKMGKLDKRRLTIWTGMSMRNFKNLDQFELTIVPDVLGSPVSAGIMASNPAYWMLITKDGRY